MSMYPGQPASGPQGSGGWWQAGGAQPTPHQGYPQPGYAPNPNGGTWYGPSSGQPNQYPGLPYAGYPAPGLVRPQRPVAIGMAVTLTVTASLQWICVLSFGWLVATVGASELSTSGDVDSVIFHMLRRFHLRMIEGLALPLYGLPLLAMIGGFLVLSQRSWTRIALTVTGLVTLAWSAWWLRNAIVWWLPAAAYISFVCLILWTPGVTQWYRQRQPGNAGDRW